MTTEAIETHAQQLADYWQIVDDRILRAVFDFKNYYHTQAFVNAVAWIAHCERHHPDISFGYNQATVDWSTHAIGGLSANDFICAAKVDRLRAD
ncbi:4a-hydroxytetrahydrobiopterin dehydratase [Salinisphaera sp. USBA-960]|nr:4a-hydroxytetrahydrobiopterin dehydratase [Salifodinibacter halophilus]NNC26181.1 4a-hydroxytetrahydrobiopterin dehydratase [Salifodinibacter halophilus]